MTDLRIETIPIATLKKWPKNARTHSKKQIRQIADSIREFGFTNPVLIDGEGSILAGHGRVAAAQLLDMQTVPCVRLETMTPAQKRAYVLADNKLAQNAGWDMEILADELKELLVEDLGFDIGLTGFSIAEIDGIVDASAPEEPGNPDDDILPELKPRNVRCRPGDVWQLGVHRLVCGDARDPDTVRALMDGELATMVLTDPPYNLKIEGNVGGLGKVKHREFAMASGEMTEAEFTDFLRASFVNLAEFSRKSLK